LAWPQAKLASPDFEGTDPMAKDVGNALIEDLAAPGPWPLVGRSSEIS
jgi:hypothetical protein